jgi:N-terminal domain in fatty acid synthase subunit beta
VEDVLKDEFTYNQSQRGTVDTTAQLENEPEAATELSASFLAYVAKSIAVSHYSSTRSNILHQLILR